MKSGLVIVDRQEEDAREQPEVRVLDFATVDRLINDDDPWKSGFMRTVSDRELDVYDQLIKLNPTKNDLYNTGTYQQLIAKSREARSSTGDKTQAVSSFALDELHDVCKVSERASTIGHAIQNIFGDMNRFQKTADWGGENEVAMQYNIKKANQADRKIIKAIVEERCKTSGGGDIPDTDFERFWRKLTS
jgi:hypothetical protein